MIYGAEIARAIKGKLIILHVINKDSRAYLHRINKGVEYINVKLRDIANGLEKEYRVLPGSQSCRGSIFKMISQVSDESNATMMVMGTHGKIGFQHLVGSGNSWFVSF
ncbi:MAG: hypothetical protein B6D64_00845 [Bacteroidetes bacterium 4484_276]|nr:MAG: hypothetical protein B6D64_00845 [Bacteroidetes bacterium 4484_276]